MRSSRSPRNRLSLRRVRPRRSSCAVRCAVPPWDPYRAQGPDRYRRCPHHGWERVVRGSRTDSGRRGCGPTTRRRGRSTGQAQPARIGVRGELRDRALRTVLNPWDSGRTAGGSSAGSAVAVAAELCCGAVGTDTGGSIRQPAAFCGIVGFKPTYGRVSLSGVMPLAPTYDHVGPMARSVRDVALMLGVMAGHDREDPPRIGLEGLEYGAAAPRMIRGVEKPNRRLRLGIPRTHFFEEMDPEISAAVDAALEVLAELTEEQRDVAVPAVTDTTVFRAEAWAAYREAVARSPELFEPETLDRLLAGQEIDPATYEEARRLVGELRSGVVSAFRDVDLLVTPATVRSSLRGSRSAHRHPGLAGARACHAPQHPSRSTSWGCRRSPCRADSPPAAYQSECRITGAPEPKAQCWSWRTRTRARPTGAGPLPSESPARSVRRRRRGRGRGIRGPDEYGRAVVLRPTQAWSLPSGYPRG